ncbi:SpoIIIAH-like family protein [Fodinisporobacter ferrooxydans]|uniref:SpoIIIAH-like family protein n=1 Tax=Fodinisporobacter ferrooxydans TaxID=2901836 RepID=A0ABY4CHX3_9BACL|nr:SpoIIIAH-like family protein [Alicyclobacillaceae bacterium MYW30-H2]
MVKRQTVWLSTMMVLSLMLIGYYTVGTNTTATNTSNSPVGVKTTGSEKPSVQTESAAPGSSKLSGSDYFAQLRMDAAAREARAEDQLTAIKLDTKATSEQVAQASKKLDQLQQLQGKLGTLQDEIKGQGFKDVLVSEDPDTSKVQVVVEATQLSNDQVVKILNTVHNQLHVPSTDISVSFHS